MLGFYKNVKHLFCAIFVCCTAFLFVTDVCAAVVSVPIELADGVSSFVSLKKSSVSDDSAAPVRMKSSDIVTENVALDGMQAPPDWMLFWCWESSSGVSDYTAFAHNPNNCSPYKSGLIMPSLGAANSGTGKISLRVFDTVDSSVIYPFVSLSVSPSTSECKGADLTPFICTSKYCKLPTEDVCPGYKVTAIEVLDDPVNNFGLYTAPPGEDISGGVVSAHEDLGIYLTVYIEPAEYEITLDNSWATVAGTTKIYTKYNTGAYLDATRTKSMTYTANPITIPQRTHVVTLDANGGISTSTLTAVYKFDGYGTRVQNSWFFAYIDSAGYITNDGLEQAKSVKTDEIWSISWSGGNVTLPTPTRTGYTFAGWYTAASGGTKVGDAGETYSPTENITLYAQWTPNCNRIRLHNTYNGGTGGTTFIYKKTGLTTYYSDSACTAGNEITRVTKPSKTNATYSGTYNTGNLSGGTACINSSGTLLSTPIGCNVNGSAVWYARYNCNANYSGSGTTIKGACTGNTYTVTLDANSAGYTGDLQSGTASVTATYGSAMPDAEMPRREVGYGFVGYFDAASGGTQYYEEDGNSARNWDKTSNTTLYAHWDVFGGSLEFDANGGSGTLPVSPTTCTFESCVVPSSNLTKSGYNFAGWYFVHEDAGQVVVQPGEDMGVYWADITMDGKKLELYALWEPIICDAGEYLDGNTCIEFVPEFTITTTDTSVFSFQISAAGTYYLDCGNGEAARVINKTSTGVETFTCTNRTGTTIGLFGQATEYTSTVAAISFSGNTKIKSVDGSLGAIFGGSGDYMFSSTFEGCTSLQSIPENLFAGVSGSSSWMFVNTFSGCTGLTGYIPPNTFPSSDVLSVLTMDDVFKNTGLDMACPAGMYQYITGLESKWNGKVSCTPCLDSHPNSAVGSTLQTQCYTSCTIACAKPTCPNNATCTYGSETAAGNLYYGSNTCSATAPTCSMTFTCKNGYQKNTNDTACVPVTYTITYEENGGSTVADGTYTIESADITLPTPIKNGYTFGGWYTTSALSGTAVTKIAKGSTGNKTFYAKWTKKSFTCTAGTYLPKGETTCSTCPKTTTNSGSTVGAYCVGGTFSFSETNDQGITACPVFDASTRTSSFPSTTGFALSYSSGAATAWYTGQTAITQCLANYYFTNEAGSVQWEGVRYNTLTGKYDNGAGGVYYTSLNPGYYLTNRYDDTYCDTSVDVRKKLYKTAAKCTAGYKCPGYTTIPLCSSTTETYGTEMGRFICTGATYSGAGASVCTFCPGDYTYNTSNGKTSVSSCQIQCAPGTMIASKYENCTSPAGGWYAMSSRVASYGNIVPVNYCMSGYTNTGTDASNHDEKTDCVKTISDMSVSNTIPARYIRLKSSGNTVNNGTHVVEIKAFTSQDGNGTNLLSGKGGTTGISLTNATDNSLVQNTYSTAAANSYLTWDMGNIYDIGLIKFAMYSADNRTYRDVQIEVSSNGSVWTTVLGPRNISTPKADATNAKEEYLILAGESSCPTGYTSPQTTVSLGSTTSCSGAVYTATLDSQYYATSSSSTGTAVTTNAAPTPIYLKYNTGWYTNSGATTSFSKLTTKPAYTGYTFGGFYTGKAGTGTQIIDANGNIVSGRLTTLTANVTLYAYWTADCNKITLNNTSNGGTGGTTAVYKKTGLTTYYSDSACTAGKEITMVTKPSKTNATYSGTYTASGVSGGTACINSSGTLSASTSCNVSGSATWYARYECNANYSGSGTTITGTCTGSAYTVVFNKNANDATGTMSDQSRVYGDGVKLTVNAFVRTGYTFAGWNTKDDGTGSNYADQAATNLTGTNGETVNLYAKWTGNTITVNYNENGGDAVTNGSCTYGGSFKLPSAATKDGSVFAGWKLKDGTVKNAGDSVTCNYTNLGVYSGTSTAVTAQWTACAAGNYCPGDNTEIACPSPYSNSVVGSDAVNDCYLTTTAGNYVAETGKGQVTCAAGGYCLGGTTVYHSSGVGITTGGRDACECGTYNANTGSSVATACTKTSAGYYSAAGATSQTKATAGYYAAAGACKQTACSGRTKYSAAGASSCKTVSSGYYTTGCNSSGNICTGQSQCVSGTYCESGVQKSCPSDATRTVASANGSVAATSCYVTCASSIEILNGTTSVVSSTINYNGSTYPACTYSASCNDGYEVSGNGTTAPACTACTVGSYGGGNTVACSVCPNGGTTASVATTAITSCYKTGLPYEATRGDGTQRCFYTSGDGDSAEYSTDCDSIQITSCDAKYYLKTATDTNCTGAGTGYWSAAGELTRTRCPTNYRSGGAASSQSGCKTKCADGAYVATAKAACVNVGSGYYAATHTVAYGKTSSVRGQCADGLTTIGYGAGANEEGDCGRVLNVDGEKLYLRSTKKTEHALHVRVGEDVFYGNMDTSSKVISEGATNKLRIRYNDTVYYVHDDSVN